MADADFSRTDAQKLRQKASVQRYSLRKRIDTIATAVILGNLDKSTAYNPQGIQDPDHPDWLALTGKLDLLRRRIELAKSARDTVIAKEQLILSVREDFPDIARKFPAPVPRLPLTEPAPAQEPLAAKVETLPTNAKRKQRDDNDDDEEEEGSYLEAEVKARCEQHAAKRKRQATKTTTSNDEDLEQRIQEIQKKADLEKRQSEIKAEEMRQSTIQLKAEIQVSELKRKRGRGHKKKRDREMIDLTDEAIDTDLSNVKVESSNS